MSLDDTRFLRELQLKKETVTDWDAYPFNIPSLSSLVSLEFHPGVTFLLGENGSEKST